MARPQDRPLRTLIVDANEAFLTSAAGWMAERPELVVVGRARHGLEALDAVERLDPDLVVIDAVLPGRDGFQVVRALKARARAPLAVVTTFMASQEARNAAFAAGADGFVAKDDFSGAFELLLGELLDGPPPRGRAAGPTRPAPHESPTEPDL